MTRLDRRGRHVRVTALALACLLPLAACSTDDHAARRDGDATASEELPPRYESRTGVPILMDLPLIGWMFRRTTTVR